MRTSFSNSASSAVSTAAIVAARFFSNNVSSSAVRTEDVVRLLRHLLDYTPARRHPFLPATLAPIRVERPDPGIPSSGRRAKAGRRLQARGAISERVDWVPNRRWR